MIGFFSKLFDDLVGGGYKDPIQAHPELGPLAAAYDRLDGRGAQAMFSASRGRWDLRTWVIELTGERYFMALHEATREQMIDFYVKKQETGWLLSRGVWHLFEGWEARGHGAGSTVTRDGFEELERRCRLAEQDFMEAVQRDAADPTGYTLMLRVAKGLNDRAIGEQAYAQAIARDPHGYEPHRSFLSLISERWMGSHDEMLERARDIASAAPKGTDAASLPIQAHYDRYSHTCVFDKDVGTACAALRDPEVLDEIKRALSNSVDAPGYALTPSTMRIRHVGAVLLWQAGAADAARAQLSQVGKTFFKDPWWQHTSDPEGFYEDVRKKLGVR